MNKKSSLQNAHSSKLSKRPTHGYLFKPNYYECVACFGLNPNPNPHNQDHSIHWTKLDYHSAVLYYYDISQSLYYRQIHNDLVTATLVTTNLLQMLCLNAWTSPYLLLACRMSRRGRSARWPPAWWWRSCRHHSSMWASYLGSAVSLAQSITDLYKDIRGQTKGVKKNNFTVDWNGPINLHHV